MAGVYVAHGNYPFKRARNANYKVFSKMYPENKQERRRRAFETHLNAIENDPFRTDFVVEYMEHMNDRHDVFEECGFPSLNVQESDFKEPKRDHNVDIYAGAMCRFEHNEYEEPDNLDDECTKNDAPTGIINIGRIVGKVTGLSRLKNLANVAPSLFKGIVKATGSVQKGIPTFTRVLGNITDGVLKTVRGQQSISQLGEQVAQGLEAGLESGQRVQAELLEGAQEVQRASQEAIRGTPAGDLLGLSRRRRRRRRRRRGGLLGLLG